MGIPVIDLFAGPGGLGEGFSSVEENGERVFDIKLSIEKDYFAHQTLLLRSFLRQFPINQFPQEYYEMLRENDDKKREELKEHLYYSYPEQFRHAKKEAWKCELGSDENPAEQVDQRIIDALDGRNDWVLIGGPPCQAYSLVGRSRNKGIKEEDHRVFLYREYLRIIAEHKPKVFVMENVKGLLSAKLDDSSIFDMIKSDLKDPGILFPRSKSPRYKIYSLVKTPDDLHAEEPDSQIANKDFLIRSELFHVPQKRHRVILLGLREDVLHTGETLYDHFDIEPSLISLESVIKDLPKIRSIAGRRIDASSKTKRKYCKVDGSNEFWNDYIKDLWNELERNVEFGANDLPRKSKTQLKSTGKHFVKRKRTIKEEHPLYNWLHDPKLGGVLNHESRSHLLEDLNRYYFYGIYSAIYSAFPRLKNVAEMYADILPKHKNALSGIFEDRFRVQLRKEPATTITSHISKDGHYFIHYDYNQCRSFTVREAARVQTFPDNYFFCGKRTQQFHQVGNAVPPYLAYKISHIVKNIVYIK